MSHVAENVLRLFFVTVGNFFRSEVVPLAELAYSFFRVEVFYRVAECVETDGFIGYNLQALAVLAGQFYPAGVGAVTVFLRTYIVVGVHGIGSGLVEVNVAGSLAVDVVFTRSATEVFHLIHVGRQAEAYADTWHNELRCGMAGFLLARAEGCHEGSFRHFGLAFFHVGRSEGDVGMYYTVWIDGIFHDVEVTGSKQIVGCQYGIVAIDFGDNVCHLEVLAALLPDLFALGLAITIVVVVWSTPEVRLNTETFSEVFGAVYLIRSNEAALLVEHELHTWRCYLHFVAFGSHVSLARSLVFVHCQRFNRQAELFGCDFVAYRNQDFRFGSSYPEVHEVFGTCLRLQAGYVYIQFFGALRFDVEEGLAFSHYLAVGLHGVVDLVFLQACEVEAVLHFELAGCQIDGLEAYILMGVLHFGHSRVYGTVGSDDTVAQEVTVARCIHTEVATVCPIFTSVLVFLKQTLVHPVPDVTALQVRVSIDGIPLCGKVTAGVTHGV